ncbi:exo-beta-N-acetylmuramidase NamZ family protein [Oceanotoga teriensis]|uniref:exo-beta-N-acetylmuramidase NamZ family protein n=1 Tax=Oceanotoga teriensis TaxID=515440 RepID=UPI0027123002|nr:DUF1343 domain-containing protein [Oceanotoga teriensis]MDO7976598.1 DUF1343 domain-containing protein [Oceanotoga teriensis]
MVMNGIDILEKENFKSLMNKKIGIITNFSFVNKNMEFMIDKMISNGVNIVKIFTPEHGLYGLPDGKEYDNEVHPKYNIPVISLYGDNKKPKKEYLEDIDLLVYDIQDVGLRFYTYIYTLAYCMISADENDKDFMILDRINPLGRKVYGGRMKDEYKSFVGDYELPLRYGLTCAETGLYYKKLLGLKLDLKIIKVEGWNGETFDKTDLMWNVPSPNLPDFESTIAYAGNCFFEATNISEGRGTTKPFTYIGAPWIDNDDLYEKLKENFKDLNIRKREFIPMFSKHKDILCHGVEFFPNDNDNFFEISLFIMNYLNKYDQYEINDRFKGLVGEISLKDIDHKEWDDQAKQFIEYTKDILIYEKGLELL